MLPRRLARLLAALPVAAALAAPGLVPSTAHGAQIGAPGATWTVQVSGSPPASIPEPYSSPAVGDLFGDGNKEVVAAFLDGTVRAYSASGQQLWVRQTGGAVDGSPTLASLSSDGRLEVVVTSRNGYINVFNPDGSNFPGWPQFPSAIGNWTSTNFGTGFFASAAVGDLFGDGHLEVVAASWDHRLYAYGAYGQILSGFPKNLYDTVWDTPLLVDLEGRGQRDILVGSDSNGNAPGHNDEPYSMGGVWWAFRPDGSQIPGWPQNPPFQNLAPSQNEVPWSSPAAAVLNPGAATSVVTGTGQYIGQRYGLNVGKYVSVWNQQGGLLQRASLSTGGENFGSPAVGDLLGDGHREIVETSEDGKVYAWFSDGTPVPGLWPISPTNGTQIGSAIIAPVDPSCSGINGVWIPGWYHILGYCANGTLKFDIPTSASIFNGAPATAAPTVADLGNGHLSLVEIYQADTSNLNWKLTVWPLNETSLNAGSWPTFHGNMLRDGTPAVAPNHAQNIAFVNNLYHDVLGRQTAPPAGDLDFWVHRLDNGAERYWVASAFVVSTEFHSTIVTDDYHTMFGPSRTPDPGGLAYWVGQLNAGVHNERLLGLFGGSDEFFADQGSTYPALVTALYQHILNRTPAPNDPGPAYWVGQLNNGLWRGAIGDVFANSHEYHMNLVASWYLSFLGRAPDPGGQNFWAGYLDQGNSDDAGIISVVASDEYYGHPSAF